MLLSVLLVTCGIPGTTFADSSNQFRVPHCSPHVQRLPIYQMHNNKSNSTVVLVGPNTFATSAHGVAYGNARDIVIFLPNRTVKARIAWIDKDKDIAVLSAKSYNIRPIDAQSFDLADHEPLWNIGFPDVADGEMISFSGFKLRYNSRGLLVTSTLALHGMSGGANVRCMDDRLELVGIITNLVQNKIETKVWTDDLGVLHQKETLINKGVSLIVPMKFQKHK